MPKQLTTTAASGAVSVTAATRRLIAKSIAPATTRAYECALAAVDAYLDGKPLTDSRLSDYITDRHDAGASPSQLRMAVAAVKFRARLHNTDSQVGALSRQALAGAVREGAGKWNEQVAGIGFSEADSMARKAAGKGGKGGVRGARDCALILTASDAMLRVSEVAALDLADADLGDAEGVNATVTIRRSKTDAEGVGSVLFIRPRTALAIRAWVKQAGIESGALFRSVNKGGGVGGRISARSVRRVIIARAEDAEVEGRVSGHSLRVGSAQELTRGGATLPELMQCGRWKSAAMAAHYGRKGLAANSAMARLRKA